MAVQAATQEKAELRRDVTVWGSYMWGFADVGADTYVALGIVIAAAQGMANLAFAAAGIVYIMIGLAYTELASAYPVAGGGQYFTLRGLGDFWANVTGSALLLDYTIDIALFAVASVGYLNFFWPMFAGHPYPKLQWQLGVLHLYDPILMIEAVVLVLFLIWLNIRGIRESSMFNEVVGGIVILTETLIVVFGFMFAWKPEMVIAQFNETLQHFSLHNFAYGSSLAIISFVGLESISQAAQETRRPATIIPRTSITLIFTVFIFAVGFSNVALGLQHWTKIAERMNDPVAFLAQNIPFIGLIAGPLAAALGMIILVISANSGVMSASRLTFSMSRFKLAPAWFDAVHKKYHTPYRSIWFFSVLGIVFVLLSGLTPKILDTLGNMYAFGATLGYILVFISLIVLRFKDPYTPRPYKVPVNLPVKIKGRAVNVPLLAFIGTLGVSTIFVEVVYTHTIGRIAGPAWVLICIGLYLIYRHRKGLPLFKSLPRNWEKEQEAVLRSAEEFDLLEQYKIALRERDKLARRRGATADG